MFSETTRNYDLIRQKHKLRNVLMFEKKRLDCLTKNKTTFVFTLFFAKPILTDLEVIEETIKIFFEIPGRLWVWLNKPSKA